jgi:two-component system response regulator
MMADSNIELLIVEDNPHDAELTLHALKRENLEAGVLVVRDGAEALEFLLDNDQQGKSERSKNLKLMLLDLKLPKLNGFEVLESIRECEDFASLPIAILSSSAVESDIQQAYKAGANSYIVKPIDFAEHSRALVDAVRYWLNINLTA